MKVLHVYRTYFPDSQGGLEEVIRQICLSTRAGAVESRVFTLSRRPHPATLDCAEGQIVRVKQNFEIASCGFTFGGISEFRRQAAWADVIHYHFPWPWADALHALAGYPGPAIVTYHSDIVRQKLLSHLYRPLMNRFLGSMARIVATSPNYFATSDVLSRFSDKVEVVPIGIDADQRHPFAEDDPFVQHVADRFGRGFFLFVGVLRYYKGLHILLNAMRDAAYKVVIVGSGPVEQELRRQAEQLRLDNVIFGGYVADDVKMALFQLCRAVVFPSYLRAEAFGVTLLEGAMCAKPLISAEVGSGTSHINIDRKTGLVVTPGCSRSLRDAMDFLYGHPEQAAQMGLQARARYEELFTGATMGDRYCRIYQAVVMESDVRARVTLRSAD
ncbi:MAG: glycosyltransferase [Pseudomonadota bacterium]